MKLRATCSKCERKIVEGSYFDKRDYEAKRYAWKQNILVCPYCGERYKARPYDNGKDVKWRNLFGDYEAEVENGTFRLQKWGNSWLWSFVYRNEEKPRPENAGVALVKEVAERACEKHKEWK